MRIHFIAVGGSAMHNLAIALHLKGYDVTGSDDHIFEPSKSRLNKHGLLPDDFGWDTSRISDDLDFVILGMHAKVDNPELIESQNRNLKIVSYPEFIYEMSKNKTRVVIGGSHGKTSITAMVLHVLNQNGREVDFMVGAQLEGFETMVHLTDENDFILLEGDEYLSSPIDRRPKFHLYKPNIALLSGISWDHINVFPTKEIYLKQFELFLETMVSGGVLVYNKLDSQVNQISIDCQRPIRKLEYTMPDYYIDNGISFISVNTFNRLVNDYKQLVMLKHEEWPGLDKLSKVKASMDTGDIRRISILTGNGGLYLPQELQRGADGAMTGFAYPEMLVEVYDLHKKGEIDAAENLFDAYLPYVRYEQQPGFGLAVRKETLFRRGAINSPAVRQPGPSPKSRPRGAVRSRIRESCVEAACE